MDFLKPTYLYLLLLIPLLLLLYVLKLRRRNHVVSSSLLWQQAIEDMKANVPFQRLRRNMLLPLQIIFLMLVIFALARPFWRGEASTAKNTILIIDNSASMKATDVDGSRFEAAKAIVKQMIDELTGGDNLMLIKAASTPGVVSDFTSDKLQLREALKNIQPLDAPADIGRAFRLASSLARSNPGSEILIMSDGSGDEISELSEGEADEFSVPVRFIGFGKETASNVGITALEVGQSRVGEANRQIFVALQNFSDTERPSILMELYHEGNLIDVRELKNLSANERRSVIFDGLAFVEGITEVVIDPDDDLDADDRAYCILTVQPALRVLLVSAGNPRLEAAVRTASVNIQLSIEKPEKYAPGDNHDLVIFDGFVPDNVSGINALFVDPTVDLPFGRIVSASDNPAVVDWDRSHPIMRFVDLANLKISRMHNYEMSPFMKPLVESDTGTLIWIGENDSSRIIVLPFKMRLQSDSNFPMLTAFPIFISNAMDWLAGAGGAFSRRQLNVGQPLKFSILNGDEDQIVTLRKPDGEEMEISAEGGRIVFNDTDMVGIYEIIGDGFAEKFAANLLSESESSIKPAESIEIAGHEITSSEAATARKREIWGSLILAALILLAVEWWVYHRRVLV